MRALILIICISILEFYSAHAQYNGNIWIFGDSLMIDWTNPQQPAIGGSSFYWRNGTSTISDTNGLLFYSGLRDNISPLNCLIWNKYDMPIKNSEFIKGGIWYHSILFIPYPGSDSLIYLFTAGVTGSNPYGFYYSLIDKTANSDSGEVIVKNVQLNALPAFDGLMAVRHGNGRDWWLFFQEWFPPQGTQSSNDFYVFLVSPSGISGPVVQSIGSPHSTNLGHLLFSNSGDKFANVNIRGLIELYNFDRCSGLITSSTSIEPEPPIGGPYPHWYATCAFSPDDSKLYVAETNTFATRRIWQFDLMASNILASKIQIDSFIDTRYGINDMKLAPDGKIYITAFDRNFNWPYPDTSTAYTFINNNLSVINYPDSAGLACDFQRFSFNLGTGRCYFGLPNNPDYELGPLAGSPCDTLGVGISEPQKQDAFFQAWYNSEWELIQVNAARLKGKKALLQVYDLSGRLVYSRQLPVLPGGWLSTEIPLQNQSGGMYIVKLITEQEGFGGKVMKL